MLEVNSKIEGSGHFLLSNYMPLHSGAYGLFVKASLAVENLTAGESISIIIDDKEVLNVPENGSYSFNFNTKRKMDSEIVKIGYMVSNAGTADVVLVCDVPNP